MTFSIFQNVDASDSWVIVDKVQKSHCLCGQVRIDEKVGAEGFLVEEFTPDLEQVIQSTNTDKDGNFSFKEILPKSLHYICVSGEPLYQTTCRKVKISKKEKKKIIIIMGPK